jgi:hypothetical protein
MGVILRFPGFHREFTAVWAPKWHPRVEALGGPALGGDVLVRPGPGADAFVQRVRRKVRAAWPDDRAGLGVNRDLDEALRGARPVENRSAHPVEDLHLAA